jgi:hypothetical protein
MVTKEDISFLFIQMQAELKDMREVLAHPTTPERLTKLSESVTVMRDILDDMDDCLREMSNE